MLVFPCENTHAMCLDCFRLYCETKLNDRAFTQSADVGYTLGCPGKSESLLVCDGAGGERRGVGLG